MAIFSWIGAAIAGVLFAGSTLAASVIAGGLAFAARLGFSYLNRPKKRSYSAVQAETQFGGDVPVGTLYGIGKMKGQRTFYAKWGKGNRDNAEVFVLANGWCDGLEPYVYFFGEKHVLVERPIIGNEVAHFGVEDFLKGDDHLFSIRFYDGRPGQLADQKLVDDTADLGQTWKATSVNAGQTYVIVERRFNADKFEKGKPDIEFVLRGLREYDPRKDSTIAGGSGPQRLDDPATWVHTLNPAVHRLNYQLGLRALISGRTLIGEGKSLGQIDLTTYFLSMNVCDTLRLDDRPTYQCSLYVNGDDDHTEVLREFDDAMAGFGLNRRGLSGVIPGAPQIPVMEITADDIPADRAKEVQFRNSAFERYNHMSGQFMSIEGMWNPESLKPVYVNADIAIDGRNRQTSNDFLQVTDPDIAQYLLNIRYRQNRKGGTATLPVSRRVGLKVQEGEWVIWRGVTWMITEWRLDEQFRITLKLSETGADIYDDDDIEPGPVVIPPAKPINPSILSTVQNFGIAVGLLTGPDGTEYPTLQFTWTPPEDPSIVAVRFEYFDGTDPTGKTIQKWRSDEPESGSDETGANIVPGSPYTARATIVTVPDRLKTWTPWVTTAGVTGDVYIPGIVEDLNERLDEFEDFIGADVDALEAEIDQIATDLVQETEARVDQILQEEDARIADAHLLATNYRALVNTIADVRDQLANAHFEGFKHIEEIRRTLSSRVGEIYAEFDERIIVATGDNGGLVQRLTRLEVGNANLTALVGDIETASIDGLNALAQQISLLSVGTNNQFDTVHLWNFVSTVEGWSGNGAPTWLDGSIRPANQASAPYVLSPTGLSVTGTGYRQVRGRVRKFGSPTWVGYLWWKTESDTTWDSARRITLAEPSYDGNGFGLLTFQLEWTGTIDAIRVELSAAQTSSDYFLIDWVGIGSPSPGASRAELLAERTARISADDAQVSDITVLQAAINSPTTGLNALSLAVQAIDTRVGLTEEGIESFGAIVDSLETEISGKATIESVDALINEIDALDVGSILSVGSAVRSIRNEMYPMASQLMEHGFQQFLASMENKKIVADVAQSLTTRIEQTNENLLVNSTALSKVQAELPNLARGEAVSLLNTRLTANELLTAASSTAIDRVKADLGWDDGAAAGFRATALTAIRADVTLSYGLASAKNKVYRSNTAPVGTTEVPLVAGDLWVNPSDSNITKRWSGTAWVDVTDVRIASSAAAVTSIKAELGWDEGGPTGGKATVLTGITANVTATYDLASAKNKVYRINTQPTGTTAVPLVAGDLWINPADGEITKRWSGSAWVDVTDVRVSASAAAITLMKSELGWSDSEPAGGKATALSVIRTNVDNVVALADAKNRIYRQSTAPTGTFLRTGDVWFDTSNDNIPNRWSGTAWQQVADARVQATATLLQSLTATVDENSANARFRMTTVAGPSGYARIAARAKYTSSGTERSAGFFIDVPSDAGQDTLFLVSADQFAIINGSARSKPFIVQGGEVIMNVANIGTVNAGLLQSTNGKMQINLNAGTIEIFS
ncbi:phage tail tip fiber protein [Shinella kummerowiae]|uniref:phage tail tip fiber protein n=1 Tax=Shinella kummerowiae TaxID=417745 RepID=UPI0021B55DE4|nr:DUF1983 domain-containing protein [Shinella kummerowiae]MCT7665657.1 DUF1983 domain-containing protein [Shinella kummerowiae]